MLVCVTVIHFGQYCLKNCKSKNTKKCDSHLRKERMQLRSIEYYLYSLIFISRIFFFNFIIISRFFFVQMRGKLKLKFLEIIEENPSKGTHIVDVSLSYLTDFPIKIRIYHCQLKHRIIKSWFILQ